MKRRTLWILIMTVFVTVALVLTSRSRHQADLNEGPPLQQTTATESAPTPSASSTPRSGVNHDIGRNNAPKAANRITAQNDSIPLPEVEDYRDQAEKNPHSTPEVVLKFAAQMGPKMEAAFNSEEAALALMPELKDCALQAEIRSIRALCFSNVVELETKYPSLQNPRKELESEMDSATLELARKLPKM